MFRIYPNKNQEVKLDRSFANFYKGFDIKNGRLNLSKISSIRIFQHREDVTRASKHKRERPNNRTREANAEK